MPTGTPTATTRLTPVGLPQEDGHSTLITFLADPDVSFWEKIVQPFGLEGGPPIEQTSMHNVAFTTKRAQHLIDVEAGASEVSYKGAIYDQIKALINTETVITYKLPDNTKWCKHGYLRSFKPTRNSKGNQPMANIVIEAINLDSAGAEFGPNQITSAGTD